MELVQDLRTRLLLSSHYQESSPAHPALDVLEDASAWRAYLVNSAHQFRHHRAHHTIGQVSLYRQERIAIREPSDRLHIPPAVDSSHTHAVLGLPQEGR